MAEEDAAAAERRGGAGQPAARPGGGEVDEFDAVFGEDGGAASLQARVRALQARLHRTVATGARPWDAADSPPPPPAE